MVKLIVGLGNPGDRYRKHRHNIGFRVVDAMAQQFCLCSWKNHKSGLYASINNLDNYPQATHPVCLLKPLTYMNLSGGAVQFFLRANYVEISECLIICDDVSLPFGKIRIRKKGSAGGQNGLKSIFTCLGTQDVFRLRFGIGPKDSSVVPSDMLSNYVLSKFSRDEETQLDSLIDNTVNAILTILTESIEQSMNRFN